MGSVILTSYITNEREREREREPLGGGMGILTSPVLHSLISAAKSAISIFFMERGTPPPFWASHALSEFCVIKKKEIFYFFL